MADTLFGAASLAILEEACGDVLILGEGLSRDDFERSRLTRTALCERLKVIADCLHGLPAEARSRMPELGWDGWDVARRVLDGAPDHDGTRWFAASSLAPATLMWLRVYREEQPALFAFTAGAD
ncbi:hypothetical protein [Methyloversatilis sp.]|uniref:hypothetical protein n=1 Tax=Methyloversatilis sp. TaxID=2569862 RepID=UPI002734D7BD|nr:hypothetical protein [Methyloversatilis sp.]MDP2870735.1 hypothetical protein [Methyloversatilis sp.]MDP3455572.1 hypothetical protein [Methyloversatilis sp.]MDP3578187.1 hypothetical protein [Methyloversatilis sp.]